MRKKKNEKTKEQGKVKRTEQEYMVIGKKKEKDKDSNACTHLTTAPRRFRSRLERPRDKEFFDYKAV